MSKRVALLLVLSILFTIHSAADPIRLRVDATDAPRDVLHSRLTIPASPGPLTLYYPRWMPGEHGPTGPLVQVAGLHVKAGDTGIPWKRDPVDMYAIHVDVPAGASSLEVSLDYIDPAGSGIFTGGGSMTPNLAVVSWNTVLLYPEAKSSDELQYEASLKLPAGWNFATSLTPAAEGSEVRFAPVSLTQLIDSPLLAARYLRRIELPVRSSSLRHTIDLAADSEAALATPEGFAAGYVRLVEEARALMGAEHYDHYDWLVTLSDAVQHFGLEHHQSSDDRMAEQVLVEDGTRKMLASLLSHEYMHSWCGKYKRPAGLAVPNYDQPMNGELLWVYEGLDTYLGNLMAARSGLWTEAYARERLATLASSLEPSAGRAWRPLQDTATEAQVLYASPREGSAYRRGTDFYDEGLLLWLDADMTIRQLTQDRLSLDDFLRRFFAGPDRDQRVRTFSFEDVVRTLNEVVANDWSAFLRQRLDSTAATPLAAIEASGWKLVYTDQPNEADAFGYPGVRMQEGHYEAMIGLLVGSDGRVIDVIPGSPAAKGGLVPGAILMAVNGRRYSSENLRIAVRDSGKTAAPLQLIYASGDFVMTAAVDYHGGLRYPHLERIPGRPDRLTALIKPLAARAR